MDQGDKGHKTIIIQTTQHLIKKKQCLTFCLLVRKSIQTTMLPRNKAKATSYSSFPQTTRTQQDHNVMEMMAEKQAPCASKLRRPPRFQKNNIPMGGRLTHHNHEDNAQRTYLNDDKKLRRDVLNGSIPSAILDSGETSSVDTSTDPFAKTG